MQLLSWQNPNIVLVSLPDECKCCLTESKHCTGFSLTIANVVLTDSKLCTDLSLPNANVAPQNSNLYLFFYYKCKCCPTRIQALYWFLCLLMQMLSWQTKTLRFSALQMQMLYWQNENTALLSLPYRCKCCPDRIQTLCWFLCLTNANVFLTESKHCTGFSAWQMQMFSWQNPNIVLVSLPDKCKCFPDRIQTLYWFLCLTNANIFLTESKHCTGFSAWQMQMLS